MTTLVSERPEDALVCWACGSSNSRPYKARSIDRKLVPDDLRITDANYGSTLSLQRCIDCGFIFADRADLPELFHLYEELDDLGYEASQDARALQMNWLLDAAQGHHPRVRSALDVGAAAGLLVSLARKRGWNAEGIEPSHKLVEAAFKSHGVRLIQGSLPHPELSERRFDAVFLVDVLEHVSDPLKLLQDAASLLESDGILMVVTPDVSSFARRLLGSRWWHFRLAHVGYFDSNSFEQACKRAQIEVTARFRAKWFFRVSYLAERLTRYLPVQALTRLLLQSTSSGARIGNLVVPLNLYDSWVFICRKSHGGN